MKTRRTRKQIEFLERHILEILEQDNPQSVRHIYYRLLDPRLDEPLAKTEAEYNNLVNRLKVMRQGGRIPYSWITDTTRRGHHVSTFDNLPDFARRVAGLYRSNLWGEAGMYCEVWCESRSLAGVLQGDCNELAVSLYPCGGFASLSFTYESAMYMAERANGRRCRIYYVGDYDPAGLLIDKDLESKLRGFLPDRFPLTFERVAVNHEQIQFFNLPTKPRKDGERRRPDVQETVEAEAIPVGVMRNMVRSKVEALLPPGALAIAREVEREEKRNILERLSAL